MEIINSKSTKELLVEHFIKWQFESGESKSQNEFAAYVGETEKYLSQIMNGRKPSNRQTNQFAIFFKDPRFYDAVGMERPEPVISYIRRNLVRVPDEVKKKIAKEVSRYTIEAPPGEDEDGK